jgi:hypothetical protein
VDLAAEGCRHLKKQAGRQQMLQRFTCNLQRHRARVACLGIFPHTAATAALLPASSPPCIYGSMMQGRTA